LSTVNTQPDPVSGLGDVQSAEVTSQIIAQNISWSPWSRLYLQLGFNHVLSETTTPAADDSAALPDAKNDYWTLNFNAGFVLDNKTDLNLGYTYYDANNYVDNSPYVCYGAGGQEHGINLTLVRRLTEKLRVTVRYGYYHYTDQTSGGNNDYNAQLVYSSLQYRFC
jgi:predicted porin